MGFHIASFILIASFTRSISAQACPSQSPASPIPGCWGQPACAYYIASEQGLPKCTPDYCFCDGTTVPLLPATGTVTSSNCDYSTQPASNIDLGTLPGCTVDQTSTHVATGNSATSTSAPSKPISSTRGSTTPAGATLVTETVSGTSLVVTYAPSKATIDVTTTTTDSSGHTNVIVIPKGQWIWGLFGPPPPGGPPPLPAPPGNVAPPTDPDTGKPDNPSDPDQPSTPTVTSHQSTSSSTVSSSSSSSAASCDPADVAIAADYPFAIGDDGEELASVTISQEFVYGSMTASPSSSVKPPSAAPVTTKPSSTLQAPPPGETVTMSDGNVCVLPDGSTDPDCNDAAPLPTRTSSAPPAAGTCTCNEDGCTDDSPACCANGSCPASVAAVP